MRASTPEPIDFFAQLGQLALLQAPLVEIALQAFHRTSQAFELVAKSVPMIVMVAAAVLMLVMVVAVIVRVPLVAMPVVGAAKLVELAAQALYLVSRVAARSVPLSVRHEVSPIRASAGVEGRVRPLQA